MHWFIYTLAHLYIQWVWNLISLGQVFISDPFFYHWMKNSIPKDGRQSTVWFSWLYASLKSNSVHSTTPNHVFFLCIPQDSCRVPAEWSPRLPILVHTGTVHWQHYSGPRFLPCPWIPSSCAERPVSYNRQSKPVEVHTFCILCVCTDRSVNSQVPQCGHGVVVWSQRGQ